MSAMHPRGFTLIELIATLVLVAALAVFVAPRLNVTPFDEYSFERELGNALRYAQKTALGSGCAIEARVDAGADSYALFHEDGGGDQICGDAGTFNEPVLHPTRGGDFAGTARGQAGVISGGEVVFDGRGRAFNALVVELTGGRTIRVEAETGYVHD